MSIASPSHELSPAELARNFEHPYAWIGMEAVFYLNGDTNQLPIAATCTAVDDRALKLTVFHPRSRPAPKTNVRHIDDPFVKLRPDLLGRMGEGTWDYSEGSREMVKRLSKPAVDVEVIKRVMEMHEQGLSSSQISAKLDNGFNYQKINVIIRNNK